MATRSLVTLPPKGQLIDRKALEADHPQRVAGEKFYYKWRFYRENYEGSGGYAPHLDPITVASTLPTDEGASNTAVSPDNSARTYLFRHPVERKKFHRRVMMAYNVNIIRRALNMINGYLTKKNPTRDGFPDSLNKWMDSCTDDGDTWDILKNVELTIPCLYYGFLPVLIHKWPTDAPNAALDEETVQVSPLSPEAMIDWVWDSKGNLTQIKLIQEVDETVDILSGAHIQYKRYWYYNNAGWYYVDDTDAKLDKIPVTQVGKWNGDKMPLVMWRLGMSGRSLIADSCGAQREYYNVLSEITEQRRETGFAMLCLPDPGGGSGDEDDDRVIVGSMDNTLKADGEKWQPFWLERKGDVFKSMMEERQSLAEDILREMGLDFDEGGGTTGVAYQFKMSKIVRMLKDIVSSLQRAENQTLREVARQLGTEIPEDKKSVWASEFDAKDVQKEMESLTAYLDTSPPSETAEVEAYYKMTTTVMDDLDEEKRQTILEELETGVEEKNEGMDETPEEAMLRLANEGQPGGGGEKFMGKEKTPEGGAR
jgi:hypothetical protein